jgi:hypothetical protein
LLEGGAAAQKQQRGQQSTQRKVRGPALQRPAHASGP